MKRRFQFSLWTLFVVVTTVALFCLATRLFLLLFPAVRQQIHHAPEWWFVTLWLGAFAAGAAGFGCTVGRPIKGEICGMMLAIVLFVLWNIFPIGA